MGTLSDHIARKAALSDPKRYAVLYYLWEREEVSRKEIAATIDRDSTSPTISENSSMRG